MKDFPIDFELYIGWTTCVTGLFHTDMGYFDFLLRENSATRLLVALRDDSHHSNNVVWLQNFNNQQIHNQELGSRQNFQVMSVLNINFTLVAFTQMRVDFGPPVSYSMVSELVEVNYLTGINFVRLQCNDMTVYTVDVDCK